MLSMLKYCRHRAFVSPNASYKRPCGSATRGASCNLYPEKNFSAFASLSERCTNASRVPFPSISPRSLLSSATASRQNVQPKCRRKTSNTGLSSVSSASVSPVCVLYSFRSKAFTSFPADLFRSFRRPRRHLLRCHLVPPCEHLLQPSPRICAAKNLPEPPKREFVPHTVFQPTAGRAFRDEAVRMLPSRKRTGYHHVPKHPSRLAIPVLRNPILRNWAQRHAQRHPRARLLDPTGSRHHFGLFPWRRQPFQCARLSVKPVNLFRRGGHAAPVIEHFGQLGLLLRAHFSTAAAVSALDSIRGSLYALKKPAVFGSSLPRNTS